MSIYRYGMRTIRSQWYMELLEKMAAEEAEG